MKYAAAVDVPGSGRVVFLAFSTVEFMKNPKALCMFSLTQRQDTISFVPSATQNIGTSVAYKYSKNV